MPNNNTTLTRPEFTAKANGWITANADKWAEIKATKAKPYQYLGKILERMYGSPIWRDRPGRNKITGTIPTSDDPGVRFFLEDAGRGKVKFMSVPTRRATRGGPTKASSGNRAFTERITSPPDTDFVDSNRRMGEANSRNMDGGHINDLERQRAGQVEAVRRGRTVQQYQQTFLDAGEPIGHTRANIEDQLPVDNRVNKPSQLRKLDAHLKNLSNKPVVGKPNFLFRGGKVLFSGGMMPAVIPYVEPIAQLVNERTDGGIDKAIDMAVEPLRKGVQRLVDGAVGFYVDMKDIGFDLELQ